MKICKSFIVSAALFVVFGLILYLVMNVDVMPIGPKQSRVGLAAVNQFVHGKIGVHLLWYTITDWLGAAAVLLAFGFGMLGLYQLIKRKSLLKVDKDIMALGVLYVILAIIYFVFEVCIINYRPVILDGSLEASFPSSHTFLVLCIMVTAIFQFQERIRNVKLRTAVQGTAVVIAVVTVVGRFISGVHWTSDIIAGVILACALITLYYGVIKVLELNAEE